MTYYNIYLPENLESNNYYYRLTDDSNVQIITNTNCVTQYTTTQCNCYDYSLNRGVLSDVYSCNRNQSQKLINKSNIGFNDTMAKYQATLYSWGNIILIVGVIWMICYFLMHSRR